MAVYIDFKAAYDKVWRRKLNEKLHQIGVKDKMLRWIKNFTTQKWIAVKFRNQQTKFKQLRVGLPQGSVLSTTLFNIFINDLPNTLKTNTTAKIAMFADDVVFWVKANNKKRNHQQELEKEINRITTRLDSWATENNMEINTDKTYYQYLSLRHNSENFNIKINGTNIRIVLNTWECTSITN